MGGGGGGFALIAGEGAVDVIEPGVAFDPDDLVTAFKAAAVERTEAGILFDPKEIPPAPERQLILEVEDAVGREDLALAQGVFGVTHADQFVVGAGEFGIARGGVGHLHEGQKFEALKTPIEASLVGEKIVGIPAAPAGGFAIAIDQAPAVVDEVGSNSPEERLGLFDFLAPGDMFEEETDGIEVRAQLIAGSVALPFEFAVGSVVPFGGVLAGTVHGLVAAFALGPDGAGGESWNAGHGLEPPNSLETVLSLALGGRVLGDGESVTLRGEIIPGVPPIVVTDLAHKLPEFLIPFELVGESETLLSPFLEVQLVISRLFGEGIRFVIDDTETVIGGDVGGARAGGDALTRSEGSQRSPAK